MQQFPFIFSGLHIILFGPCPAAAANHVSWRWEANVNTAKYTTKHHTCLVYTSMNTSASQPIVTQWVLLCKVCETHSITQSSF